MPAFNFQPRFADLVESGQKTQTIRKTLRGNVGDTVYLYTGQRTKQCRKLGEGVVTNIETVSLYYGCLGLLVVVAGKELFVVDYKRFARADGFASVHEMAGWFKDQHGLPFDGFLYKWVKTD